MVARGVDVVDDDPVPPVSRDEVALVCAAADPVRGRTVHAHAAVGVRERVDNACVRADDVSLDHVAPGAASQFHARAAIARNHIHGSRTVAADAVAAPAIDEHPDVVAQRVLPIPVRPDVVAFDHVADRIAAENPYAGGAVSADHVRVPEVRPPHLIAGGLPDVHPVQPVAQRGETRHVHADVVPLQHNTAVQRHPRTQVSGYDVPVHIPTDHRARTFHGNPD